MSQSTYYCLRLVVPGSSSVLLKEVIYGGRKVLGTPVPDFWEMNPWSTKALALAKRVRLNTEGAGNLPSHRYPPERLQIVKITHTTEVVL